MAEKYKYYCYDLVTARILPKVNYNWKKAAAWCRKSEKNWVNVCFQSMGRDASGYTRLDPARSSGSAASPETWPESASTRPARTWPTRTSARARAKVLCNTAPAATRDYCLTGIGEILGSFNREAEKRKASCDEATENKAYRKDCYRGAAVT